MTKLEVIDLGVESSRKTPRDADLVTRNGPRMGSFGVPRPAGSHLFVANRDGGIYVFDTGQFR
ncbi:MAG: hypothetical protein ABSH20_00555 [Tepidisphaeraceae bacterium]|jgi:hypothetical protein